MPHDTRQKRTTRKLVTMSPRDQEYLRTTKAALYKQYRLHTNDSQLVALGIALLRQKSLAEIERLVKKLDTATK